MLVPKRAASKQERICPADVRGVGLLVTLLTPTIRELVTRLELGQEEPKALVVDSTSTTLVLTGLSKEEAEENLKYWLAYRLGEFSSVPVVFITLDSAGRRANSAALNKAQAEAQVELTRMVPAREEEEEEDYPEEDDDPEPPYEPEEEEEPF